MNSTVGSTQQAIAEIAMTGGIGTVLNLTFRPDGLPGVQHLAVQHMRNWGFLIMEPGQAMTVMAIDRDLSWGGDASRRVTVKIGPSFEIDWFLGRIGRELEKIEVIT